MGYEIEMFIVCFDYIFIQINWQEQVKFNLKD